VGVINIEGIKLYAYHGVLGEEQVIGQEYIIDVFIDTDFSEAAKHDDLTKTIDYSNVYQIVKSEMAIKSRLIEHVGQRIVDALLKQIPLIQKVDVKVNKLNPPVHGYIEKVSVVISGKKE
jgi:dihydroneopterin aldolase